MAGKTGGGIDFSKLSSLVPTQGPALGDIEVKATGDEEKERQQALYRILRETVLSGNNKAIQTLAHEDILVDDSWIRTIEDCLFSLENIAKKPTTFIIDEREKVPVEKAKRTDGYSVRYLASHSEDVRKIDDKGYIEPIKVMNRYMKEDIGIYENRVVYTLIQKLKYFVEERYESIRNVVAHYETTNLILESKFPFGRAKIEYSLNMKVSQRKKRKESGETTLSKLERVRKRIMILDNTDFARQLSRYKLVTPPLNRTNLLTKNTDYRNAYNLWLFISSFRSIGYSVTVADKVLDLDKDYYDDLTDVIIDSLKAMLANNMIRKDQYRRLRFRDKKTKEYNAVRKVEVALSGVQNSLLGTEDAINQFYYDKIKSMVKYVAEKSKAKDVVDIKEVNENFRRFYKGLVKINNELVYDMLKLTADRLVDPPEKVFDEGTIEKLTPLQRRQKELRKQKEILKKYKVWVDLKEDELESLRKKELALTQKMHKLEVDVSARLYREEKKKDELREKEKRKKARAEAAAKRKAEKELKEKLRQEEEDRKLLSLLEEKASVSPPAHPTDASLYREEVAASIQEEEQKNIVEQTDNNTAVTVTAEEEPIRELNGVELAALRAKEAAEKAVSEALDAQKELSEEELRDRESRLGYDNVEMKRREATPPDKPADDEGND